MSDDLVMISRMLPDEIMAEADRRFNLVRLDSTTPLTLEQTSQCLRECDAVVTCHGDDFSAEAFRTAETTVRCRILANYGAGYDHIDVNAAKEHGVCVTNTPGAVTEATADIALTLILMTARRAAEGDRLVRAGRWSGWQPAQLLGTMVYGQTLGVIGMGRIGQAIAKRCHFGFNMNVVFHNRSRVQDLQFPAVQLSSAAEVCERANFVVIAVRSGPGSYHLVDSELLSSMRRDAALINISRGDVVDEQALINALVEGRIGAAGLDVYEFEPHVPDELKLMQNVVLLPHLGTSVLGVRNDMGIMTLDNLSAFFKGDNPPNLVTGE